MREPEIYDLGMDLAPFGLPVFRDPENLRSLLL